MAVKISKRILDFVNALPLAEGQRILEIGSGPGVAAREIARRFDNIQIVCIDRSEKIVVSRHFLTPLPHNTKIQFRHESIETSTLEEGNFDFAFAMRVGALDGRHPEIYNAAIRKIASLLKPGGKLYIDGGDPLKEIIIPRGIANPSPNT